MNAVRMPRWTVAGAVLCLFALALYAVREYGSVGAVSHLTLGVGAGLVCLAIVAGLIWANYVSYRPDAQRRQLNGTS